MTKHKGLMAKTFLACSALIGAGFISQSAVAGTDTANQNFSLVAEPSCTVTVPDVDFGTISSKAEVQQAFDVTVTCEVFSSIVSTLTASGGNHVLSPIASQRRMKNATINYIDYEIYRGATFTGSEPVMGDGGVTHSGGTYSYAGEIVVNFVAVVPAVVAPRSPGNFSDTVVGTIDF